MHHEEKDKKSVFLFGPEASAAACSPSEIDYLQLDTVAVHHEISHNNNNNYKDN